jgi:hypothetical protein
MLILFGELNHVSSTITRSLIWSRRFVVITYVAVVAIAMAPTATTVRRRLLKTGEIARLSLKILFLLPIFLASQEKL